MSKLLQAIDHIDSEGHHTATIKLSFGAIERSLEAFTLAKSADDLRGFHDHTYSYERASALGLLSPPTTERLEELCTQNRTDSYYGGRRPTGEQATALQSLAREIHEYVTDQTQQGGVYLCEGSVSN